MTFSNYSPWRGKINMQDYSSVVITVSCVIKSGLPGAQGVHLCLWC